MRVVLGNIVTLARNGEFDAVIHATNCFCDMSQGVAAELVAAFPAVAEADQATISGDVTKIGTCSVAEINLDEMGIEHFRVFNAYTQYSSRANGLGTDRIEFDSIRSCLLTVKAALLPGSRIGYSFNGPGLVRRDWVRMERLIIQVMAGYNNVAVHQET